MALPAVLDRLKDHQQCPAEKAAGPRIRARIAAGHHAYSRAPHGCETAGATATSRHKHSHRSTPPRDEKSPFWEIEPSPTVSDMATLE